MDTSTLPPIDSMASLRHYRAMVQERIRDHEQRMQVKVQSLPNEAFIQLIDWILPVFVGKKLSTRLLGLSEKVIHFLLTTGNNTVNSLLATTIKKVGIITIVKMLIRLFFRKSES